MAIGKKEITLTTELATEEFCKWLSAMAKEIRSRKASHPLDWDGQQTLQEWIEELSSLVEHPYDKKG